MHLLRLGLPLCLLPALAQGSSQLERSIADRARDADRVVLAQVLESRVHVPDGDVKRMTTVTTLWVRERYKGAGPDRLEVVQLGGTSGLWDAHLAGDAVFEPAETVLVFLRCRDASVPQRCTLLGLGEGKLRVENASSGQQIRLRQERRALEAVVDEIRGALKGARPIGAAR
jgi:hypothetical protein